MFFKPYRKILLFLGVLIVLSPLGIILPEYIKSEGAWGEWPVETVKEQSGQEPAGMKRDAGKYKAPVEDYDPGKPGHTLRERSAGYLISGLLGTGIILMLTFGAVRLMSRNAGK